MRIAVVAVGRLKDGPERELAARYLERATQTGRGIALGPVELAEVAESRARRAEERKRDEATALAALADPRMVRVALDERGRALGSAALADWLAARRDAGAPGVAFLIGGADGLARDLVAGCDLTLSFGVATWPHQLVRIMLAEQLYRAASILTGHPYHRV